MKNKFIITLFLVTIFQVVFYKGICQERTNFCDDLTFTYSALQSNESGCFIDVTYHWQWTPGGNANQYPHGIEVLTSSPAQVTSLAQISGFNAWSGYGSPIAYCTNPALLGAYSNSMAWYSNTAIPSVATLRFRVYVNANISPGFWLKINVLSGWPVPTCEKAICRDSSYFKRNVKDYRIYPDIPLRPCKNGYGLLTISPLPLPPGTIVEWYRAPMTAYNTCPPVSPFSGLWTLAQTGGTTFPTNPMSASECFVAIIKEPCFSYITPAYQVQVCPNEAEVGPITYVSTDPAYTASNPNPVNDSLHACLKWKGKLSASWTGDVCYHNFDWYLSSNNGATWNMMHNYEDGIQTQEIPELTVPANECSKVYRVKCNVTYSCGGQSRIATRFYNIKIYNKSKPGTITASPFNMCGTNCTACNAAASATAPILCYDRATVLTYSGGCGKIVRWESASDPSGPWITLASAGTSSVLWTNKLTQTMYYRVYIKNGTCSEAFKQIKVTVKPLLAATIAGCNMICPSQPCVLSISTNYNGTVFCSSYKWYKNGVIINGQTGQNLAITTPSNYYALVSDAACDVTVKTNVIKVCKPELLITGPCGLCTGQSGSLSAVFKDPNCQPAGCTYVWRKNGVVIGGANSSTINVNYSDLPATFEVIVNCNNCGPFKSKHVMTKCP